MAAVDDERGEHAFAINCLSLATGTRSGLPDFPQSFEDLLRHRRITFINVDEFGDIDNIARSFFRKQIDGISYMEAARFFELAWGPNWHDG